MWQNCGLFREKVACCRSGSPDPCLPPSLMGQPPGVFLKNGSLLCPHLSSWDLPLRTWRAQCLGSRLPDSETTSLCSASAHAPMKAKGFPPHDSARHASCHHAQNWPGASQLCRHRALARAHLGSCCKCKLSPVLFRFLFVGGKIVQTGLRLHAFYSKWGARVHASLDGRDVARNHVCEEPRVGPHASKCQEMSLSLSYFVITSLCLSVFRCQWRINNEEAQNALTKSFPLLQLRLHEDRDGFICFNKYIRNARSKASIRESLVTAFLQRKPF